MTDSEPPPTWLAVADRIARGVEPRSREIEAARRLPQDIADELAAAGLYGLLTPRRYGGAELHPRDFVGVVERLARSDAAVAWCCFIACNAGVLAAYLPADGAAPRFGRPGLKAAGVFAPRGRARPATLGGVDGYRVSGRWAWGSGAHNADVISGGCLVHGPGDDDAPRRLPDGSPYVLSVLFERSQVRLLDNWDSVGLCGTGSGEFEVDDAFVPAQRTASLFEAPVVDGTLYRFPVFGLLAVSIAAVSAGIARRAIDEFVAVAAGTVPQGGQRTLAERATVQQALAQAEAGLRSARAFLVEAIDAAWDAAATGGAMAVGPRRDLRLAATHLAHASARVVDRMYTLAGGSAVFAQSPLQRCLRDVHVATQHLMVGEGTWELVGRSLAGLPTQTAML
jgi:alkylation response protein AidB-like acyl-CoA dehydrogenase